MSERTERVVEVWESVMRQDPDWEQIAPQAVYVQHFGQHGGEYTGHDGIRGWLEELRAVWPETIGKVEDATESDDAVHARFHIRVVSPRLDVEGLFRGRLEARFDDEGRLSRFEVWDENADW